MRTTTVVLLSTLLGVLVGFGTAKSALTVNGWNPELEYKKHEELVREIQARSFNENAKAKTDETLYDFGIKDVKERGEHKFTVTNVGTAPLRLDVNRTTCSCTGIDPQSQTIAPGATGTLTVKYNAERAIGFFKQGGTIITNDPGNPEIYLAIQGVFTAPVTLSSSLIAFPNVQAGATRTGKIRLYGFEKTPMEILSTEWKDKEHFDLKFEKTELSQEDKDNPLNKNAKTVYEGTITLKPGLPVGTFQEKFHVKTNIAGEPNVEFMACGQIYGSGITLTGMGFNKESGVVSLGTIRVGQRIAKDISIMFSGAAAADAKLAVKSVKPDWLKTTLTEPKEIGADSAARRRFYSLTIEVPTGTPVCNYTTADEERVAMIVLETGIADTPTIKIPVQFAVEQ